MIHGGTLAAACAACVLMVSALPVRAGGEADAMAGIAAVNAVRAEAGLGPVSAEPRLVCAASAHAADLARREVLDHLGGDGADLARRLSRAGYPYLRASENLARADDDPAAVVALWMESLGHRRNLLDGAVSEVGLARDRRGRGTYWVLVLASPTPDPIISLEKRQNSADCNANPR